MMRVLKKNRLIVVIALFVIWGCLVLGTGLAYAQGGGGSSNAINLGITYGQQTGLGTDDIRLVIARVIRAALGLLGIIALVIILYGGYVYMTAAGNEEKVAQAKKILINGVIGLMIILASLSIVQFILSKLQEATLGGVSENCQKTEYAQAHWLECFPVGWDPCKQDPIACCVQEATEKGILVAKSITPVTANTGMNNVGIRALFNLPLDPIYKSGDIFKVFHEKLDITNKFDFVLFTTKDGNVGVEAKYKADSGKCLDGITPCLDAENIRRRLERT